MPDRRSDPGQTPADRLLHTIAVFSDDVDDDQYAITATSNYIPGHRRTGVTWGDLKAIARELSEDAG